MIHALRTLTSSSKTSSPASVVLELPPMFFVCRLPSIAFLMAPSTALASLGRLREYRSIMATGTMVSIGFTNELSQISGAEPIFSPLAFLYIFTLFQSLSSKERGSWIHPVGVLVDHIASKCTLKKKSIQQSQLNLPLELTCWVYINWFLSILLFNGASSTYLLTPTTAIRPQTPWMNKPLLRIRVQPSYNSSPLSHIQLWLLTYSRSKSYPQTI